MFRNTTEVYTSLRARRKATAEGHPRKSNVCEEKRLGVATQPAGKTFAQIGETAETEDNREVRKDCLGAVFYSITGGNISVVVNNFHGGNGDNEKPLLSRPSSVPKFIVCSLLYSVLALVHMQCT